MKNGNPLIPPEFGRTPEDCQAAALGASGGSLNVSKPRRRRIKYNASWWRRQLADLAIATSLLTGCAKAGFEVGGLAACPPVVEYSREFQARAAEELEMLPDGSAVVEMMEDYAVIRDQARACKSN